MRGFVRLIIGFVAVSIWATPVMAQIEMSPLEGEALRQAHEGRTLEGIYKIPRARTGMDAFTETFNADGTTEYREGPVTDTGHWTVQEKLLCFKYDGALAGGISCFVIFQSGTCYYAYSPRELQGDRPRNPNRWSVKAIFRGDVSTCDDLVS